LDVDGKVEMITLFVESQQTEGGGNRFASS